MAARAQQVASAPSWFSLLEGDHASTPADRQDQKMDLPGPGRLDQSRTLLAQRLRQLEDAA
jgi:hypothetical protein